ncbi:MAG: redoxin domain-containing protein [Verrucomicrobiaceae bacterium]|nr:redoxin domain-containing protein [Verrucomicrobiaceae bacterium]
MNIRLLVILATGLVSSGIALTQQSGRGLGALEARFDHFDANKDGVLSGDELNGSPVLPKLDLDHDGRVTKQEALDALGKLKGAIAPDTTAPSAGENRTGVIFRALDKNGDARLSPEELTSGEIFDRLDLNKDGAVTLEESLKVIGATIPEKWLKRRNGAAESPAATPEQAASLQERPKQLKGSEQGVGRMIPDIALTDTMGTGVKLGDFQKNKALVIALFGTSCPVSLKLAPELARIEKEYGARNVGFLLVAPVAGEKPENISKFINGAGLTSAVVHDVDGVLAAALGATTTTEVFVLDAARTLVYRGAINDQYGLGYAKDAPSESYLRPALDAVLRSAAPVVTATTAPGCALDLRTTTSTSAPATPTWHREISRIVAGHCVECHRAEGLAPFSLETYADVIEHAGMIKKQVTRGAMPPWFAAKQPGEKESPWANDCSLDEKDKAALLAWLDSPRAEGDPKDAPVPHQWPSGWSIGQPDYIVQLPRPIHIKAEGTMPYQVVNTQTTLTEDKWVQAYEIMPTDRKVVHHVIVSVHPKGTQHVKDRDEGAGGYWAAYVPGNSKEIYPDGFARKLPAGSVVSFQIHYTPSGKATQDQLRMGLVFAKSPPRYMVQTTGLPRRALNIPPGDANHVEVETRTIPFDMNVMGFLAHLHLRGKSFKYEVVKPDGSTETLLDIPRYDFNWQLRYTLGQYRTLPRGTILKITAVYDNSAGNPANPDPTATVRWGQQTQDEMMIGYIEHFVPVGSGKVAAK